jgi:YidC/Oxa1 family membrane protein insertase
MWASLVELVRASIFTGAHLLGGSIGASVVLVSTLVRLALMPLVLRAARHARAQQAILAGLAPQLEAIKKKYRADPPRLFEETQALYRKHGVRLLTLESIASVAVQLPLLGALFSAVRTGLGERVRFLWIADLSRVDGLLVAAVATVTGIAAAMAPVAPGSPLSGRFLVAIAVGGTLLFLWSASSAIALSVGAGAATSVLQNWLLRRDALREARVAVPQ